MTFDETTILEVYFTTCTVSVFGSSSNFKDTIKDEEEGGESSEEGRDELEISTIRGY